MESRSATNFVTTFEMFLVQEKSSVCVVSLPYILGPNTSNLFTIFSFSGLQMFLLLPHDKDEILEFENPGRCLLFITMKVISYQNKLTVNLKANVLL